MDCFKVNPSKDILNHCSFRYNGNVSCVLAAVPELYLYLLSNESSKTEWHSAIAEGERLCGQFGKKPLLPGDLDRSDIKVG